MPEKVPEKLDKIPAMTVSQAETMVSGKTMAIGPKTKRLINISQTITEVAEELTSILPDSHITKDLNRLTRQLGHEIDFHNKYLEQHEGANWLARYVAEQCAVHYVAATEKPLTYGNDPYKDNEPSTDFGRLVKNALSHVGVEADWRRPTKLACKYFDVERGIVTNWS